MGGVELDATTRKEAYDLMVKRFNEQFPSVTVTRIAGGAETLDKLITMMASDTRADIVGTRPDYLASYMEGPKPSAEPGALREEGSGGGQS